MSFDLAGMKDKQSVLVVGASGSFALQFANRAEAKVIGTASKNVWKPCVPRAPMKSWTIKRSP
jgi:NADPH:quinone reductase-like Zn-dependent oxidoreductase